MRKTVEKLDCELDVGDENAIEGNSKGLYQIDKAVLRRMPYICLRNSETSLDAIVGSLSY